ncbi:hypothetical protein ILYODFUR_029117 [Ilyodon furcidens]|uniref:Uncharacterized protein n=1 Tax=Ilyodon furcidens TaxID=33524 RepID=A0ABV0TMP7_9TELE
MINQLYQTGANIHQCHMQGETVINWNRNSRQGEVVEVFMHSNGTTKGSYTASVRSLPDQYFRAVMFQDVLLKLFRKSTKKGAMLRIVDTVGPRYTHLLSGEVWP